MLFALFPIPRGRRHEPAASEGAKITTSHIQTLRALLRDEKGVLLPGAPNALTARIIEDLGSKAVYLTGGTASFGARQR